MPGCLACLVPGGGPGTDDRRRWFASSPRSADHRVQAGRCSGGRQDEPDRASRKRSCQSGVDCGYQVVVPFGYASHADRVRADGQAAAVDPPWDASRRADEGARGSDRRAAWPRQSRSVSQINFRVLVPAPQHDLPRVPRLLTASPRPHSYSPSILVSYAQAADACISTPNGAKSMHDGNALISRMWVRRRAKPGALISRPGRGPGPRLRLAFVRVRTRGWRQLDR